MCSVGACLVSRVLHLYISNRVFVPFPASAKTTGPLDRMHQVSYPSYRSSYSLFSPSECRASAVFMWLVWLIGLGERA